MDLMTRERDRLLWRTARIYGVSFTFVSIACAVLPGAVEQLALLWSIPLYAILLAAQFRMGVSGNLAWIALADAAGIGIVIVYASVGASAATNTFALPPLIELTSAALAASAIALVTSRTRIAFLIVSFVVIGAAVTVLTSAMQAPLRTGGLYVLGWALAVGVGVWIVAAIPQVQRRIASIGRAHRAERQASELEAQRRQSARLLHDTVLATLTLLAHSGVGVTSDVLRQQAGQDARLLRQLRLGVDGDGEPSPRQTDEPVLGTTLESVKSRFGRMGLEVTWHGTGQVLLPSDVLDAFLLALAECLENVRRHSGVTQAHVTITEDETTVRALVTDQGVGFDIADVDEAKLGFKESVVARLRDVGGNARLFSSPGAGTTVALEVPREARGA